MEPAVELDILDAGWELTVDTNLNRVPKAFILEAVGEANCISSKSSISGSAGGRRDGAGGQSPAAFVKFTRNLSRRRW